MNLFKEVSLVIASILVALGNAAHGNDLRVPMNDSEMAQVQFLNIPPISQIQKLKVLSQIPKQSLSAFTRKTDLTTNKSSLKQYCISIDQKGKRVTAPKNSFLSDDIEYGEINYYPLSQPGKTVIVAIIETVGGRPNVLNPTRGFNYGPIPMVKDLKPSDVETLWGKAYSVERVNENLEKRTYRLIATNCQNEPREFFVDCVFTKTGLLVTYKIRGPGADEKYPSDVQDDRTNGIYE